MNNSTKSLMIQGTSSHAGKSLVTAIVLRILSNRYAVSPFKAQNMSLNTYVTREGLEDNSQFLKNEGEKIVHV